MCNALNQPEAAGQQSGTTCILWWGHRWDSLLSAVNVSRRMSSNLSSWGLLPCICCSSVCMAAMQLSSFPGLRMSFERRLVLHSMQASQHNGLTLL